MCHWLCQCGYTYRLPIGESTGRASGTLSLPAASAERSTGSDSAAADVMIESSIHSQQKPDSDDELAATVRQSREELAKLSEPDLSDTVDQVKTPKSAEEVESGSDDSGEDEVRVDTAVQEAGQKMHTAMQEYRLAVEFQRQAHREIYLARHKRLRGGESQDEVRDAGS